MTKQELKNFMQQAIVELWPDCPKIDLAVENPAQEEFGDLASNACLLLAPKLSRAPAEVAKKLIAYLQDKLGPSKIFAQISFALPGFINFTFSPDYLAKQIKQILQQVEKYGQSNLGQKQKVQVEFISANPTGPLTLGNGRGGFMGACLAKVLQTAGYQVQKEYYVNDAGSQIEALGHSVLGDELAVYKGGYIEDLKKQIKIKGQNAIKVGQQAQIEILKSIRQTVQDKMGIEFDNWFLESSLHKNKLWDKALRIFRTKDLVYEKEQALWFRARKFGLDKDAVLIRTTGQPTYLASDLAYFLDRFSNRKFAKVIMFLGADHHGDVARLQAGLKALSLTKAKLDIVLMQLVRLISQGKEVRMSKRAGTYITIDELIDEVGLDAARFHFLSQGANSHMNFDLEQAKDKSEKNPVYYVQYAVARIHSILAKLKVKSARLPSQAKACGQEKLKVTAKNLKLNTIEEISLARQLVRLPELVQEVASDYQVQKLPPYALEVAEAFHSFYTKCRVIKANGQPDENRLALLQASLIVLQNTLNLMGISAPKKM